MPVSRDPADARAAKRAVAVVDEQSHVLSFHQSKRYRSVVCTRPWYAVAMLRLRRPSAEDLARLLAGAKAADLSYAEVGATRGSSLPAGYRLDRYELQLGSDETAFDRAAEALRGWKAHLGAGVEIFPEGVRLAADDTVLLIVKAAGLWAVAPCRVVYVVDEPASFRFAYGTLPGHPEQGEAEMNVQREAGGDVVFRIVSFSRPVDALARFGSPVTRLIQRRVTNRYLQALARESASRTQ